MDFIEFFLSAFEKKAPSSKRDKLDPEGQCH